MIDQKGTVFKGNWEGGKSKQKAKGDSFKNKKVICLDCKSYVRWSWEDSIPPNNRVTADLDESYFSGMENTKERLLWVEECMGGHNLEKVRCKKFFDIHVNKILCINKDKIQDVLKT